MREATDARRGVHFFDSGRLRECLDVSLSAVTETLKAAEDKLRAHRHAVVSVASDVDEPLGIVAKSPKMQHVVDLARRVAKVNSAVLITGESGVGKEYILAVLKLNDGNQTRTAAQLKIGSATLYRKLKSYGLIRGRQKAKGIAIGVPPLAFTLDSPGSLKGNDSKRSWVRPPSRSPCE